MKITKLMSANVKTVNQYERLSVVRQLFIRHKFHHLMVINNDNELVGVISERDYLKATNSNIELPSASNKDLAMLNKRVHQIISKSVVSINSATSFSEAINIFHDYKVSCLPVVNDSNTPVGIITWRDIIRLLYSKVNAQAD